MKKARLLPAAFAGFGLIRREPLAVVLWSLTLVLLYFGPMVCLLAVDFPDVINLYSDLLQGRAPYPPDELPPVFIKMMMVGPLAILGGLIGFGIVYTAIMRATLFPESRAFAYMRLGWAELRTIVIGLVLYILFIMAMIVVMIVLIVPIGLVTAISVGMNGGDPDALSGGLVGLILATELAVFLAVCLPFAKLAMAIPMSVAEKRFRLFEAWNFTKGYGLRLVGLFLVIILIVLAIEVVVYGSAAIMFVAVVGGFDEAHLLNLMNNPLQVWPFWAFLGIVYLALVTVVMPITVAPWARAYQRIADKRNEQIPALNG